LIDDLDASEPVGPGIRDPERHIEATGLARTEIGVRCVRIAARQGAFQLVLVQAVLPEDVSTYSLTFTRHAEGDVERRDHLVAESLGLPQRQLEHLLGARRERDLAARLLVSASHDLDRALAGSLETEPVASEHRAHSAVVLADEAKQEMLGAYVVVIEPPRLFLS